MGGVLTDGISRKATRSLQGSRKTLSSTSNGRVATARYADKRLERFFRSITDIASGYLGEAQLSGYKVVHIDTTSQNDTESRGRPLAPRPRREPAEGVRVSARRRLRRGPSDGGGRRVAFTHYRTDAMGASRFADDYVRKNYEVAKLCGPKGGGFVVDTH